MDSARTYRFFRRYFFKGEWRWQFRDPKYPTVYHTATELEFQPFPKDMQAPILEEFGTFLAQSPEGFGPKTQKLWSKTQEFDERKKILVPYLSELAQEFGAGILRVQWQPFIQMPIVELRKRHSNVEATLLGTASNTTFRQFLVATGNFRAHYKYQSEWTRRVGPQVSYTQVFPLKYWSYPVFEATMQAIKLPVREPNWIETARPEQ